MDICHLQMRNDILKNDSGSHAVFTEQSLSSSQMTAARVMDVIAGLPECAGQAADRVSVYTQITMEDAPSCSKFHNQNVLIYKGDRYLWPERPEIIRPEAVVGRIISGFRDKRKYVF